MQQIDVIEGIGIGIEEVLFGQWKHMGWLDKWDSEQIVFVVDGKRYILKLREDEQ